MDFIFWLSEDLDITEFLIKCRYLFEILSKFRNNFLENIKIFVIPIISIVFIYSIIYFNLNSIRKKK